MIKYGISVSPWVILSMPDISDEFRTIATSSFARMFPRKAVKPNSNFHKMLQYVNDHPGEGRSGWYRRGLGNNPEGLPTFPSDKAADGVAALYGLITVRDPDRKALTYQLRITDNGRRVLNMLDQGQTIRLSDLIT